MRLARRFVVALALAVSASACAKGGPPSMTAPSPVPTPTPSGPVYAPPPEGLLGNPELWRIGFSTTTAQLFRPKDEQVHLDVSALSPDIQAIFMEMAAVATDTVQGKTTVDLVPTTSGGSTFVVSVEAGLMCGGVATSGCTSPRVDGRGNVMGGTMKFSSLTAMQYEPLVLHEIFRTFGIAMNNPNPGIMSGHLGGEGWNEPRASDEERIMFLGRYEYPLLSLYSPG